LSGESSPDFLKLAHREVELQLRDGEHVISDERYSRVSATNEPLSRHGWTSLETEAMAERKWSSQNELIQTSVTVWPENLLHHAQIGHIWLDHHIQHRASARQGNRCVAAVPTLTTAARDPCEVSPGRKASFSLRPGQTEHIAV
jgi:hypothetical protein